MNPARLDTGNFEYCATCTAIQEIIAFEPRLGVLRQLLVSLSACRKLSVRNAVTAQVVIVCFHGHVQQSCFRPSLKDASQFSESLTSFHNYQSHLSDLSVSDF